ncbi:hypothetical protein GARC_4452 [Paraglaciecola arctica BSs20135]|uniref:Uncharacterized protein n=1 Tax=Paraglaciecola arctica BSs20135 TaxID=493475 RepID=K6XL73_9ALTE|nr:hypothetical protein GARC_4452 [Paraglaciecola arctica BSs20135]
MTQSRLLTLIALLLGNLTIITFYYSATMANYNSVLSYLSCK